MPNRKRQLFLSVLAGVGLWFIGLVMSGESAQSALAALPPRPAPATPEKPLETGGYIQLQVEEAPADTWTVVQWQDALGDWHDVEGWQGMLDDGRIKLWWVAPADFATGPFRWAAYTAPDGEMLGLSAKFSLPGTVKEVIQVELPLDSNSK
ncbi:MAG: hypothetical protein H6669_18780 [Ardenticatenaceae bacterium]|nr:hypothetical protein [Ardenticatenaceae bacterium]